MSVDNKLFPKISIVTPSFNQAEFLEECIDSILSQNYPNLEYIIMDGGSTDNSVEIIKKYKKHLTYWQSKKDNGQYTAINEGFQKTNGEIMAWLNSDDKYHPGSLWIVSQIFKTFRDVQWVMGRPTAWDEKGLLQFAFDTLPKWSREKYLNRQFEEAFIQQESTFWRRSLWEKTGSNLNMDIKLAADFELWARFFRVAQLYVVDAMLGGFRYHSKQKTAFHLEEYKREAHEVIDHEIRIFQNSPEKSLLPPPPPITIYNMVAKSDDKISPTNFPFFTYSKEPHFAYFKDNDLNLYGVKIDKTFCDLKVYQDLLVYTFIKDNISKGSKILEIGGGDSRILRAIKKDYECWNIDKLEGLGSGPTAVDSPGIRLVRDYMGNFNSELPDNYFDFIFSISALEHVKESEAVFRDICLDIDRVLKAGCYSLHCLDIVIRNNNNVWANKIIEYFYRDKTPTNIFVPLSQLNQDPYLYAMSKASYEHFWQPITSKSYEEFGKPLSYNVLWQKDSERSQDRSRARSAQFKKIPVVTSIAPKELEKQKDAIKSWLQLGFDVISLNIREEIEQIRQEFPDVKFIEAKRDGREIVGKPCIFFDDIIGFFKETHQGICGIINSDIVLHAGADFQDFLYREAKDSFLFGARIDVESLDSLKGNPYEKGFDYFFFDSSILSYYPPSEFLVGIPWWDYWVVLIPIVNNIPIKKVLSPIAYHMKHEFYFSHDMYIHFGQIMADYITHNVDKTMINGIDAGGTLVDQMILIANSLLNFINKSSDDRFYINHSQKTMLPGPQPEYKNTTLLSIILQGRNDSYMGNFDFRLATNINKFSQNIFQLNAEKDVEIVLLDWGSEIPLAEVLKLTDNARSLLKIIQVSPQIAAKYNKDSPYSCVYPVNAGIRNANGQYILFCDADTYTPLETMKNLLALVKNGSINNIPLGQVFLMGSRYHIPKSFHISSPSLEELDRFIKDNFDNLVHDKVDIVNFLGTATAYLFTRDMLFECRGFDERLIYWGWWDIDLFYRLKRKYNAFDLEDFNIPFFHLEHYSDSKHRNMVAENPRRLNVSKMPESFAPNDENWGLANEKLEIIPPISTLQDTSPSLSDSELNKIIPPEIKNDEFYFLIQKLASEENIRTVLEIGSSAGEGSTDAFVTGLRGNPNKPLLFCMEISAPRFEALQKRYKNDSFVKCYNVSSVSLEDFPSKDTVSAFYQTTKTSLNNYPLDQVLGWLQQDIEYVKISGVPSDGIERIKQENNIMNFDVVLIDGSEFTGTAELDKIYGAKFILIDDINAFKNFSNYQRLVHDPNYVLLKDNWKTRNGFAIFKFDDSKLPMHFFTIVLNGEPFIRYHINVLKQLPFKWHWHIIEGVAELKHDTAWSVPLGGRVTDRLHSNGLSNDGTTEYLNKLAEHYPDNITIYRKPKGVFWNGKLEMVSAPLPNIHEECILHEIDADELWTFDQFLKIRQMFLENPEKTAAYYWCHFFVGESLVTTEKNAYSKNPSYEWIRTWRFNPACRWISHEPPKLCIKTDNGQWADLIQIKPFMHDETESRGLIFQHYAYVTEEQLKFKEIYYGYKNAVEYWKLLQKQSRFPIFLNQYFLWVNDSQQVNTLQSQKVSPIASKNNQGKWIFTYYKKPIKILKKAPTSLIEQTSLQKAEKQIHGKILIDGVIFQLQHDRPAGISRVWKSLLTELAKSHLADKILLLDRDNTAPFISGIQRIPIMGCDFNNFEDNALYLEDICREQGASLFISTYFTYPENSRCALMLHDMIPEIKGLDLMQPEYRAKPKAIGKANAYFAVSQSTANDLQKLYPENTNKKVYLVQNAVDDSFRLHNLEEIAYFRKKHDIKKPYFLFIGHRLLYKNALLFFKAFSLLPNKADYEILCAGGSSELEKIFMPYVKGSKSHVKFFSNEDFSSAYSGAIALVYPSQYEGFGLPVLEAMKSGCPVITCRNSAIPEVAGDAALYVDEIDVLQMRDALEKVQQPEIRASLISKGLENVKRFSWKETGLKIVSAIQEIMENIGSAPLNPSDPLNTPGRLMYLLTKCPGWKQLYPVMVNLEMMYTQSRTYNDALVEKDESIVANMDSEIFNLLHRSLPLIEEKNYLMYYFYGLVLEKRDMLLDALKAYKTAVECWQANHAWRPAYLAADVAQRLDNLELAKQLLTSIVLVEYPAYAEAQNKLRIINDKLKTRTAGNIPEQRGKEYVRVEPSGESKLTYDKKGFKVSAIISTHNSERFIRGCIDDLVNQTLYKKGELELIVVDSGSEQNEKSVIEEFRGKYKNIRYIRTEECESIYKAWNRGIKAASGEYITNANTDDRHRNDALEVMANLLDGNQDIGLVYADQIITDGENETFENHTYRGVWRWPSYSRELLTLGCCIGPQPMWRKALHDTFGFFDESFEICGDWEFWLRIAESTRMLHIPDLLGLYFSSSHSAERRNPEQKNKEDIIILQKYRPKYFKTPDDVERGLATVRQLQQGTGNPNAYSHLVEDLMEIKSVLMGEKSFHPLPPKVENLSLPKGAQKRQIRDLVSIIVIGSGNNERIKECLKFINDFTQEPHEIILNRDMFSDNTWLSLEHLSKNYSNMKLIGNYFQTQPDASLKRKNADVPAGLFRQDFSVNVNQCIHEATGEYLAIIDDSMRITKEWLTGLLECLNSASEIGIVGPLTNGFDSLQKVILAGTDAVENIDTFAKTFREQNRYRRVASRNLSAGCVLFRRDLIEKIGLFDEQFDTAQFAVDDYCLRASLEGYRNVIAGDVFIYQQHVEKHAGNSGTAAKDKNFFANKWSRVDQSDTLNLKLVATNALHSAEELLQRGTIDNAIAVLLDGIRLVPDEKRLHYALVDILIEEKRFKDCLDVLKAMPEGLRRGAEWYEAHASCNSGLNQFEEAERQTDEAIALNGASPAAWNIKGFIAFKKGNRSEAERLFTKAIEYDRGFGEAYCNLAALKWLSGDKEGASALFEKAFILSPSVSDVALSYYTIAANLKQFVKAAILLKEAIALYPFNKKLRFTLMDILLQQAENHQAMKATEEAMLTFGIDDNTLSLALGIREKIGPMKTIKGSRVRGFEGSSEETIILGSRGQGVEDSSEKEDKSLHLDPGTLESSNPGSFGPSNPRPPVPFISLCMIVKDEEKNIARCLMSVRPVVDEMIVVDTGSTDRTKDIAIAFGAQVYDFVWTDSFADARNFAISKAEGSWILVLDADEVISNSDHNALKEIVRSASKPVAYSFITRNYVDNPNTIDWIDNNGQYAKEEAGTGWFPGDKVRLFPKDDSIIFEFPVHERVEPSLILAGVEIQRCAIPVHHYGKLDIKKSAERSELYYRLGKIRLAESGKDNVKALYDLAVQASEVKKYEEALEYLQQAIAQKPDFARAHLSKGNAYFNLGRYEDAISAYAKANELDPDLKDALLLRATCHIHAGKAEDAIPLLEDLLRRDPSFLQAVFPLTVAHICAGDKSTGIKYLNDLSTLNVNAVQYVIDFAKALMSSKRISYAVSLLLAVQETNSATEETAHLLNKCYEMIQKIP